jgi:hypothetical protein
MGPTYAARALAGEFGPLDDSNEAALRAAFEDVRAEEFIAAPRGGIVDMPALMGLQRWEYIAVMYGHPLIPILRAHRERRELEAQLSALGALVCEMAAERLVADASFAAHQLMLVSQWAHGYEKLYGDGCRPSVYGADAAESHVLQAARAMGVEVDNG